MTAGVIVRSLTESDVGRSRGKRTRAACHTEGAAHIPGSEAVVVANRIEKAVRMGPQAVSTIGIETPKNANSSRR